LKTIIVIPTYNEAENISKMAAALFALPLNDFNLLIVDDNSPDGTGQIAEDLGKTYGGRVHVMHRPGKMGLGTAYIQGFTWAIEQGYEAIGQMDADFSHDPLKVPELLKALKNYDIVTGSRYVAGGSVDKQWPLWRKGLSAWGSFYARTILGGMPLRDVTGGFRFYRKNTLAAMPLKNIRSNGYVFQVEMAYVAHRLGFKFFEVPIYFADRRWGKSKMSFRIQLEAALRVWQLPGMYKDLKKLDR
jgi:dolichol-phosphate mannosyltransferase